MSEDNQQIGNNPQLSDDFRALGFDPNSGEWDMLVLNNPHITIRELVQSYLAIARSNYGAITWNTIDDAVNDNTGIFNKRNITRDVLASYSSPSTDSPSTDAMDIDTIPIDTGTNPIDTDEMDMDGGKRKKTRKRITKRSRKSKRRKTKKRKSKRRSRRSRR